jgi:transcriptional regulator with XRE-family HTH domain
MANFAQRLKELRLENKFSQKSLAEAAGLSESTIQSYERNTRTPTLDALISLADCFEVSIDVVSGRAERLKAYHDAFLLYKASQPLVLEKANTQSMEYLQKEYNVTVPCSSEELSQCRDHLETAWNSGERTAVRNFERVVAGMQDAKS